MAVVADAAPLIAAGVRQDHFHRLAVRLVAAAGRDLIVPDPVIVKVDWMLRDRVGTATARLFLDALVDGAWQRAQRFRNSERPLVRLAASTCFCRAPVGIIAGAAGKAVPEPAITPAATSASAIHMRFII